MTLQDCRIAQSFNSSFLQSLLSYAYGKSDVLHEAHLNHVQKCQKFSGSGRRGRARARHQQGTALARAPREAHRSGSMCFSRSSREGGSLLMSSSCTSTPAAARKLLAFLHVVQVG